MWGTIAGTLVNVSEVLMNVVVWVRQPSPNFANRCQTLHEGARMLLAPPWNVPEYLITKVGKDIVSKLKGILIISLARNSGVGGGGQHLVLTKVGFWHCSYMGPKLGLEWVWTDVLHSCTQKPTFDPLSDPLLEIDRERSQKFKVRCHNPRPFSATLRPL